MPLYILKRILLMIPTLFGIMVINFIIVQAAPGGPVEQTLAKITNHASDLTTNFSSSGADTIAAPKSFNGAASDSGFSSKYRGAQGLDPELIKQIEKLYGFDKPA